MSMFKNFFNKNRNSGPSKFEFWEIFELKELIQDLTKAQEIINQNYDNKNQKLKKFIAEFDEELYNVSHDNVPNFTKFWKWFEPNGTWAQLIQNKNNDLMSRIYHRADRWKRNNEFVHGTKIKLNNEYGIILLLDGKEEIRWDTKKAIDREDWTGLFGTFIESGGIIIDQSYEFQFIDENGKLK